MENVMEKSWKFVLEKLYEPCSIIQCSCLFVDITATCILESFQNSTSIEMAERVLNEAAKVSAAERYQVNQKTFFSG